jgi:hypothetical protein
MQQGKLVLYPACMLKLYPTNLTAGLEPLYGPVCFALYYWRFQSPVAYLLFCCRLFAAATAVQNAHQNLSLVSRQPAILIMCVQAAFAGRIAFSSVVMVFI